MYSQWGGGGRMHSLTSLLRMPMHKYHPKGEGGGRFWLNGHSAPPPYRCPCISTIPKGGGSFSTPPLQVILWYRPKEGAFSPPCGCPCVSISKSRVSISTVPRGRGGGCGAGILPPPPYGCPCISTILKGGARAFFPPPPYWCSCDSVPRREHSPTPPAGAHV